ncbi:MAG: hypothetical protein GEU26_09410 [Nitrososphaeraceae archaeon]|nr:hypothetical protein [Nitrososphaeraceae archaeon]
MTSFWGVFGAGLVGAAVAILAYGIWSNASEPQRRAFLNSTSKLRLCTIEQMNFQKGTGIQSFLPRHS